jgi:hypothetical protein
MATRKATVETSSTGAKDVSDFPKATRNSTKLSPYLDDVADMIDNGKMKCYDFEDQASAVKLGQSLRSIARSRHNKSLEVVIIPKATPTHPAGIYVRNGGEIVPKERKSSTPAKATATAKKTTTARKSR